LSIFIASIIYWVITLIKPEYLCSIKFVYYIHIVDRSTFIRIMVAVAVVVVMVVVVVVVMIFSKDIYKCENNWFYKFWWAVSPSTDIPHLTYYRDKLEWYDV